MNRAELVKVLELVKPALATSNMVPIFQCLVFRDGQVGAYDDTIAIIGPCDPSNFTSGDFAVHGNTLLGLLSNSSVDDVSMTLKGHDAVLTMGKSVSKLPFQPPENFIFEIPQSKWTTETPITESFIAALKLCLGTVSNDATQAALLGVTAMGDKLYSCNGDVLTRVTLKKGIKGRTLLPTAFCEALLKLWSTLDMVKGMLLINDEWVMAAFDEWSVWGRVLEIPDPINFEELVENSVQKKTQTAEVPSELGDALCRARVLSDAESQRTVITVSKGRIGLLTETHMGAVSDTVPFDKGHPDVVANVNASHLFRGLQSCDRIVFYENCVVLEKAPDVLQLVSNMS